MDANVTNLTTPFDGSGDVDEFVNRMEAIIAAAGATWNKEKQAIVLRLYLRNEAWTCWNRLTDVKKKDRGTDIILYINEESAEFLEKARVEGVLNKYCNIFILLCFMFLVNYRVDNNTFFNFVFVLIIHSIFFCLLACFY